MSPVLGIERRAWFDLNGDGQISDRSAAMGGDAYLVGDGNGDGRVAQQLTYEPLLARSRPAPSAAPTDDAARPGRNETRAADDPDPVAAAVTAASTRAERSATHADAPEVATHHDAVGKAASGAVSPSPAPAGEAAALRPDAALVRRAEAAYREMSE